MNDKDALPKVAKNNLAIKLGKISRVTALPLIGIILIGCGSFMVYKRWYATHHHVSTPQTASVNIQDEQNPSETPILVRPDTKPPFNYEPTQPKIITLPSINTDGYIQNVGVNSANAVGVPSNIHLAGWYTKSVIPGLQGLSIIDGHVQGRYDKGIFSRLAELKIGDLVTITYGNDTIKNFKVSSVQSYSVDDATQALFLDAGKSKQLRLITCSGNYNNKDHSYDKRVIVSSNLLE